MLRFFGRKKRKRSPKARRTSADRGTLVFENTSDVIQAEKVLKKAGWAVRVMGPLPEIRTGCALVIEFPLIEELNILRELDAGGIAVIQVVPVTAPCLNRSAFSRPGILVIT